MTSLVSKVARIGLLTRHTLTSQKPSFGPILKRHGHHAMSYRSPPEPDKNMIIAAEVAGAFMWWWIFWHCFTDYGHIIGEFSFPDASKWTDKELGIDK